MINVCGPSHANAFFLPKNIQSQHKKVYIYTKLSKRKNFNRMEDKLCSNKIYLESQAVKYIYVNVTKEKP